MPAPLVINLICLVFDPCSVYLFYALLPIRNKKLFWGTQIVGMLVVRLMRAFVGNTMGLLFLPLALGVPLALSEGPLFRRALVVALGFVILNALELPCGILWQTMTGADLFSYQESYEHLLPHVLIQTAFAGSLLLVSVMVAPFARRFLGEGGYMEASTPIAALAALAGTLLLSSYRGLMFLSPIGLPVLVVGTIVSVMSVLACVLLLHDVQSAIAKTAADQEAQASIAAADNYMRRYAHLEHAIEQTAMLRHDIRNQVGVVGELVAQGEREQAVSLVAALAGVADEATHQLEGVDAVAGVDDVPGALPATAKEAVATRGGAMTHRSYAAVSTFYVVNYVALALWVSWVVLQPGVSLLTRMVGLVAIVAGAVLMPRLLGMLRDAVDEDVASQRAIAARELLAAQRSQGQRLAAEAREAAGVLQAMASGLDDLADCASRGDADGIAAYAESTRRSTLRRVRWCDHSAVNMLLELKDCAARDAGVRLEASVELPRDVGIPALDLCAVFSNMLDNAISAARKAPQEGRWVRVAARERAGFLFVRVENGMASGAAPTDIPSDEAPRPGIDGHGWGLRILEELARRHDGQLVTHERDGVHVCQVTLAVEGNPGADVPAARLAV